MSSKKPEIRSTTGSQANVVIPSMVLALAGLCILEFTIPCPAQSPSGNPLGIPFKPDPAPEIDGDLGDWAEVANAQQLASEKQVSYGREHWMSSDDLSATVRLAWRHGHLYLAVDVTDDRVCQTQTGLSMWQGDHVELYVDATPNAEPDRELLGRGQFQFGLSPGRLPSTGNLPAGLKPEAVVFSPAGMKPVGVFVAAKRTIKGYALEAEVPWSLLSVEPDIATSITLEVAVSDTDGDKPAQETMMTLLTTPWNKQRTRLAPAVLSHADGKPPLVVQSFDVFASATIEPNQAQEINFSVPKTPAGREAVLTLMARLEAAKTGGNAGAMRLLVNGQSVDGSRLVNKGIREPRAGGKVATIVSGDLFIIYNGPDFESPDKHPTSALEHASLCLWELRITDLLKEDRNTLTIKNDIRPYLPMPLVVGEGRIEFRPPTQTRRKAGPPTGPLNVIAPAQTFKVAYSVHQEPNNDLLVTIGNESFRVKSEFSTPEPKWQKTSNKYFTLQRRIEKRDESIMVYDTFTNRTSLNLPLMQQHRVPMKLEQVWLGGLSPSSKTGSGYDPANPTSFGRNDKVGIGLLPMDDVFQIHVQYFSDGKSIGIADRYFVLKPKATHTAHWAIIPVATPDYFAFVNAARRVRDVNFTIDGSFAFLRPHPHHIDKWSDEQLAAFVRNKTAKYLSFSSAYPRYKGKIPHGTAFQTLDLNAWKGQIKRWKRVVPDALKLAYFHCFIDVLDGADALYPDARTLNANGEHVDYGKPGHMLFCPAESNTFGRAISKNVDIIFDTLGLDGVYWDEMAYSRQRYHYGEPWDGVSAAIHPKTMQIITLRSSVTLLSQPWRIAMCKRIMKRGPLIGNYPPSTPTMAKLRFPRFTETGQLSHCARTQLYTPIALGDHLTEHSEVDAYRTMLAVLDYGCVYYWYHDLCVIPTHPHLTKYMFPITPLQLGEGYIIGTERIITNHSGLYGWSDNSRHEVHVFNDQGREVSDFQAPTVTRDGNTFTELRIGEDWSAAIVRHQ